jgi:hypothetical protein
MPSSLVGRHAARHRRLGYEVPVHRDFTQLEPAGRTRPEGRPRRIGCRGPQGEPGQPGAPGGLAGRVRVFAPSDESSVFTRTQTANCPPGKVPIGGGARIDLINASFTSVPEVAVGQPEPTDTGWVVEAHEVVPTDLHWIVIAYAVCADPA